MDGKIIDEMRQLYQLFLKVVAAPGGDPGDDGDDKSDEPPKHHPQKGDPISHQRNYDHSNSKEVAHFDNNLPRQSNGSEEDSHHNHHGNK